MNWVEAKFSWVQLNYHSLIYKLLYQRVSNTLISIILNWWQNYYASTKYLFKVNIDIFTNQHNHDAVINWFYRQFLYQHNLNYRTEISYLNLIFLFTCRTVEVSLIFILNRLLNIPKKKKKN